MALLATIRLGRTVISAPNSHSSFFIQNVTVEEKKLYKIVTWWNDLQQDDTQQYDTQQYDTQHKDIQHNSTVPLCWMSLCWVSRFTYCYADAIILSVVMLKVVMLSVTFYLLLCWFYYSVCRYAECRYAECRSAVRQHAKVTFESCNPRHTKNLFFLLSTKKTKLKAAIKSKYSRQNFKSFSISFKQLHFIFQMHCISGYVLTRINHSLSVSLSPSLSVYVSFLCLYVTLCYFCPSASLFLCFSLPLCRSVSQDQHSWPPSTNYFRFAAFLTDIIFLQNNLS